MSKTPFHKVNPPERKYPRGVEKPREIVESISWHIRTIDKEGPWRWKEIDGITLEDVLSKVSNFETMKWVEILKQNNHVISISKICPDARNRLETLRQDDVDELISLRLSGKNRVWGIRDRNILKILWWDPEHTVCPSLKRHT